MTSRATRELTLTIALLAGVVSCASADDTSADDTPADSTPDETVESTAPASTVPTPSTVTASPDEPSAETSPETSPETRVELIEQVIADFVAQSPGGVDVLLERGGTSLRSTAGAGSIDGEELEPGRPLRVGSVSKPFVAVMVMQLVDETVVDLDAPLETYLPDTAVGADATIRQLLSHQSGIPNYTDQPTFFAAALADPTQPMTPTEILDHVIDVAPREPDQFAYSNTNYILLGQLIEQLDGADLNTSLRTRITGPLGLDDTFFDTGVGAVILPDDLVGGWSSLGGDGDPTAPYQAIASGAWAAGSLISTVDDLAAFISALASDQLVSSDSFAEMTDVGPAGYGLGLLRVGFSPTQVGFGHNGSIPGYTSTLAIDPATGDTLVILTNDDALIADQLAFEILTAQ